MTETRPETRLRSTWLPAIAVLAGVVCITTGGVLIAAGEVVIEVGEVQRGGAEQAPAAGTPPAASPAPAPEAAPEQIDHLILAIDDLQAGIAMFEKLSGVRAVAGGRHPHLGTQNALVALGPRLYLEILAPHPEMKLADGMAWLRDVTALEPMGWAVSTGDLQSLIEMLRGRGYETTAGAPGSRARPDGATLSWTTMGLTAPAVPAAPFFIEWGGTTEHPATTSPGGCSLASLAVAAPDPEPLSRLLDLLRLGVTVEHNDAPGPSLAIRLQCPNGPVLFEGYAGLLPQGDR